jgi:hypothetical protein
MLLSSISLLGAKWREAGHRLQFRLVAETIRACPSTFTLPHIFTARCLIKHGNYFITIAGLCA